jgi:type IV pilus assembly protein PilP
MNYAQNIKRGNRLNCPIETLGLLGILSVTLLGCSDEQLIDLEQYTRQIKSRSRGTIESLPAVKLYEIFTYQASDLRNPFIPTIATLPSQPSSQEGSESKNTTQPDLNRYKEALEEYTLDSLRMVGTLEQGVEIWAIVRASNGMLYRVKKGNYMGRNHGRIISINEEMIELTEIVPDERGGWSKRQVTLTLAE